MKLLLVEDDPRLARYVRQGLSQSGQTVDLAVDGAEGFDLAQTEEYDVIIMDWMLPEMDGPEVCQKLREAKIHTPILMLTAKDQTQDLVNGLESGADDYMAKPFKFDELLARIKALSRRQPKLEQSDILQIHDLKLDLNSRVVIRGKKEIKLTKKEFALLEFLMRKPGRVFSSQQLVEKVWPYDSDVLSNTVQVYVGYLRKKIDKPFPKSPAMIQTVRGFGYKLNGEKENNGKSDGDK